MGEQLIILYAYMYIVQSEQHPKNNACANDMTPFSKTNTLMQCGKDASHNAPPDHGNFDIANSDPRCHSSIW